MSKSWFVSFVLLLLGLTGHAWAQTTQTYAYQNNAFVWDAPSGAAVVVAWDNTATCDRANDDTKRTIAFPGGFTFTFGGATYTQVRILTNGILQFSAVSDGFHTDYTPQALPAPASTNAAGGGCPNVAPLNILLPYWIDITTTPYGAITNANVRYELLGTAPNRRFVVTWDNVALFGNPATRYSFQAVLYEGASAICTAAAPTATQCANGEFEYRYTTGASTGTGATVGVQLTATDFTQYAFNQAFIDTTNGTNLRWYPAPPLAQQPLAAEYRFDDAVWAGTQGEVRDTSGNGLHGVRVGTAATTATQFRICRAATIPNNTSNAAIDAAALGNPTAGTGYAPGSTGAATFWYRPNANNADAMLLDATAAANRPFFIMRTAANGIRFSLADSAGAIVTANTGAVTAANTWIHVAVSWKVAAGTNATILQVFINGALSVVQRGTTNGTLATLARPAFVGDNRSSGVTPSGGTGNSANGFIDEVRIYNGEISVVQALGDFNATRASCAVLTHFDISINGVTGSSATNVSARTCEQATVVITARDSANNPVVIANNATLSVSTNHGVWTPVTGVSGFTDTGNGGAAFTFNNTATATFSFQNTFVETSSLNINSGGIVERAAADPSLVTTAAGCAASFNGCEPATPQCTPTTPPALGYAALFTKLAGTAFSLEGVTLKADGTLEPGFSGSVAVDLLANINTGVSLGANNCPASQDAVIALGNANFSGGRATVSGINVANAYRDVRMRFTCSAAVCGSAITRCSSDNFAIRPQRFTLSTTTPLNPVAPSTNKLAAGEDFNLTANPGVTVGYTGAPAVSTANVVDHALTAVNAALTWNNPTLPLPGVAAPSGFPQASGGSASNNFQYHDVGTISFSADAVTDAGFTSVDQANSDCVTGSTSNTAAGGKFGCTIGSASLGPLGRFHPHHFAVNASFTPGCVGGGFTYMDHDALGVVLNITAQSKTDATTTRYASPASTYVLPATLDIKLLNGASATDLLPRLAQPSVPARIWTAGAYTAGDTYRFDARNLATPLMDGPYDNLKMRVTVTDATDGVQINKLNGAAVAPAVSSIDSPTTRVRYGILRLENAYGSELLPIRVPVRALYCNAVSGSTCTDWRTNTDDACTSFSSSAASLDNYLGPSFTSGNFSIAAQWNVTQSRTSPIGTGSGVIVFDRPSPVATGSVDLTLIAPDWLKGTWTSAGAWNENPKVRLRLGSPKAPYIYLRERY